MRVIYFHQHFTTPDGAGGTRSYEFARALIDRGHEVVMVCGRNDRSSLALPWDEEAGWHRGSIDGIDVIALPLQYSNKDSIARRAQVFLKFAWRSAWLALREDYDLLFATSTPLTAAIPGIAMKLCLRRKPFVFEVRDLWPELPRALGMKNPLLLGGMSLLEWLAYQAADACIGLAPGIAEGIRRRAPKSRQVELIPNGCDLDLFNPAKREPITLPGIQRGDFVAGFIGAHGIANGLDAVLDAAAELKRRGRDEIKLVLIGDGNRKESLVARATREGLDNVHFFPPIKKTDVARITASLDCGLQILANVPAFYYGTSPNKFFDYISAGVPVLINYPGWLNDLVRQNGCGVAVPPGDAPAFADALEKLAVDRGHRIEMGQAARRLATRDFSRKQFAGRFVDQLEAARDRRF